MMSEFLKYAAMRDSNIPPIEAYISSRSDGLNQLEAIRMLREVYALSLVEAKKVSFEADTSQSAEKPQPGLEKQFTDALDDLLGD